MPRKKQSQKESVPPKLRCHRAIALLWQQLARCEAIEKLRSSDPEVMKWENMTISLLEGAFGKPNGEMHANTSQFAYCDSGEPMHSGMSDEEIQWHHQLETRRRRALLESSIEQLEILSPAASQHEGTLVEGKSVPDALRRVASICRRSHLVARQLRERRQNRPPLEIADEYDVQDLLHALLRLHFDDIRPEEWTPSYAGKSSRMDFLLKPEQIVIETKVTREKRGTAQVSEELIIDAAHYREHPDCKTLVCFVHDPQGHISNPRGFEADIEKLSRPELQVICIITQ